MFSRKAPKTRSQKSLGKVPAVGSLRTSAVDASVTNLDQWSEARRCHHCGSTHEELGGRVLKCGECGAHFAPFFFSELTPDALLGGASESLAISSAKNYRPLVGFTWWWHDSSLESGESVMPRA
jgi:hypothetical protein